MYLNTWNILKAIFGGNKRSTDDILHCIYKSYKPSMDTHQKKSFSTASEIFSIRQATYQPINTSTKKNEQVSTLTKAQVYTSYDPKIVNKESANATASNKMQPKFPNHYARTTKINQHGLSIIMKPNLQSSPSQRSQRTNTNSYKNSSTSRNESRAMNSK